MVIGPKSDAVRSHERVASSPSWRSSRDVRERRSSIAACRRVTPRPGIFSVSKLLVVIHANASSTTTVASQNAAKMRQKRRRIMRSVKPLSRASRRLANLTEEITAAMDRRDRRAAVRRVAELAPEIRHVHVDRAIERAERTTEHRLGDTLLADDAARFAQQQREKIELGRGQRDGLLVYGDAARRSAEPNRPVAKIG